MTELIISEKPKSAQKIAAALADGAPKRHLSNKIAYYSFKRDGKDIVVASTVGHIYGLAEINKGKWTYPIFNIEWKPTAETNPDAAYSKKYLSLIKKLAKTADSIIVATDYDVEGSVIGYNIVRFACNKKDAKRMKFSTLTKKELTESYNNASEHLDFEQAIAGETRHYLDFFYGINVSRALTSAVKTAGLWHILSSGRVQGPALKIVVEKEKEIRAFIPEPYWEIRAQLESNGVSFEAMHKTGKFFDKSEADAAFANVEGRESAVVESVSSKEFQQKPPVPFDLTTLQTESYAHFKIKPNDTLALAQELYTSGVISYPRTSSQKLPKSIGFKQILEDLSKQDSYSDLCSDLLKIKSLSPNEGKKSDPAHPAIYPTGEKPGKIAGRQAKVYDLIVRRFLAVFGEPATRSTMSIKLDINTEIFSSSGTRTLEKGWHVYYGPYVKLKESELPSLSKGQIIAVTDIAMLDKHTEPPKRFTPASIIRELEKRSLGTKATRAQIVDTLYQRNYVVDDNLKATDLGLATVDALQKSCPDILDEDLTRHFESEMELIREGKKTKDGVIEEAKEILGKILEKFRKKESDIGSELAHAVKQTREDMNIIGKCLKCGEGSLRIIHMRARNSRFVACNAYPKCKTTFSLPRIGLIKRTDKPCKTCNHPIVLVIRKGKRPWRLCINSDCPDKADWVSKKRDQFKKDLKLSVKTDDNGDKK